MSLLNKLFVDKKLFENLVSLGLAQSFNFLIPIITLPILIKTMGLEEFGMFSIIMSLSLFFAVLTEFGISITGVKYIAQRPEQKNQIFTSLIFLKTGAFLVFIILYVLIVSFYPPYTALKELFIYAIGIIVARIFVCDWIFQGKEKMRYIALSNMVANVGYLIGVSVFAYYKLDIKWLIAFKSLSLLAGAMLSMVMAIYLFKLKFILSFKYVKQYFRESFEIFFTSLTNNVFMNTPVLIIGSLSSLEVTGAYSSIERFINFGKQILMILNQAYYPRLSRLYSETIDQYMSLWKKTGIVNVVLAMTMIIGLWLIKSVLFGYFDELQNITLASTIYDMMSWLILINAGLNMMGLNGLIIIDKSNALAKIQFVSLLLYLLSILLLFIFHTTNALSVIGIIFMVEIFTFGVRFIVFNKNL